MIQAKWISNWDEAKAFVRSLEGKFKSDLFRVPFRKGGARYPYRSLVLHDGEKLCGMLTCRYVRKQVAVGIHHVWEVGDFDTAEGTEGYGRKLLEEFMRQHGMRFVLGCWDDAAGQFWLHMADAYGFTASEIGKTLWGSPRLLLQRI